MKLSEKHPELIKEWSVKNEKTPHDYTYGSAKKVWWICERGHEWMASVNSRTNIKSGCPFCSGKKVCEDNCLRSTHPHLLNEWNYNKNIIKPNEITYGSDRRIWWICSKGHEWTTTVASRTYFNTSCPCCGRQKVSSDNNLTKTHPHLIDEWDYDKNIVKPEMVFAGTLLKVWWKCDKGHEWQAQINSRKQGRKCPYCSNKKICEDNNLEVTCPEVIPEWDYEKNVISPLEVSKGSNKKVWWKCENNHEWQASISSRTKRKRGCPKCKQSYGEKSIAVYLTENKIKFKQEFRFNDCRHKNPLPFDFAVLLKDKVIGLIEFQGIQHFEELQFKNERNKLANIQLRDKIKKEYCIKNNIPFLEINYKELSKIESILSNWLEQSLHL